MYHYTECGLTNVWLQNGFTVQDTPYGKGVSIVDVQGLHRLIGTILARQPRLSAAEFRFLRKELDLSQRMLAGLIGTSEQNVSLWERRGRIPPASDRLVRLVYLGHVNGNVEVKQVVEQLAELDRCIPSDQEPRLSFRHGEDECEWREAA